MATDMDFNVEGELKATLVPNVSAKTTFSLGGEQKSLNVDVDVTDVSSAAQFQYASGAGTTLGMSYMQSLTPSLALGGVGQYALKKRVLQLGAGAIYDHGEHLFGAQYGTDSNVSPQSLFVSS